MRRTYWILPTCMLLAACAASQDTGTGLVIRGEQNRVYRGLKISTTSGPCILVHSSANITITESQIGPCGTQGGLKHGIQVEQSNNVQIYDSYIHPEHRAARCCDTGDGIFLNNSTAITIQGNVIAYGETNISAPRNVRNLRVTGNFLLNPQGAFPRGQQVQAWHGGDVIVEDNYTLASTDTSLYKMAEHQEDAINFGNGTGFTARNNFVEGGSSASGCGIIADDGASGGVFENNILLDTAQCGIGIASGERHVIRNNTALLRKPIPGGGNTAIYVWNQYQKPCGPVEVSGNIATMLRANGTQSGYWKGAGCDPVTNQRNTWNESARRLLEPAEQKLPRPAIPPKPFACAAQSPFTTQREVSLCR